MDWAEEKYDVSFTLFNSSKSTKLFRQWINSSSYCVCLCCRNSSLLKSKWCWRSSFYTSHFQCSGPSLTKRYLKVSFTFKRQHHLLAMETVLNSAFLLKGSRWTLQATTMDGNFVRLVIKPTINIFQWTKAMCSCSNNVFMSAGATCYTAWSDAGKLKDFYYVSLDWCTALYLRKFSLCNLCFWKTVNPILILTLVPIMDSVIYPLIKKCGLNFT